MSETIVIAGAGHAAGQVAVSLRHDGFAGRIIIVGDEPWLPYQRPPLSKKFLAGEIEVDRLLIRHAKFYAEHSIETRLSTRVVAIDRDARTATLSDGDILEYDRLVLATGSHVRRIDIPGVGLTGVGYLRTIADVEAMRDGLVAGNHLVVIGAGYIGLEVAAVATTCGLHVTVLELADRVMSRVASPPVSAFFERVHTEAGVEIRCSNLPGSEILGDQHVRAVRGADGVELPADLVCIGVGVVPATELAEAAGLDCDNGIVVDEYCRSSDPSILAVGDCTNHPNSLLGRRVRLESVHNAQEQAKTAAATICGQLQPYAQIPWFWSDQYDLKLQIVGLGGADDQLVVRGDPNDRAFAVFYMQGDRICAVEAVNRPREFMLSKKLIAHGARIEPEILADTNIDFKALATAALA